MSITQIAGLALEALLGVLMAYTAYTLFAWTPPSVTKRRDELRYPRWWWVLAGIATSIGAVTLLIGLVVPIVGATGILWVIAYFVVACCTHLVRADFSGFVAPLAFLGICIGLLALRWGDAGPLRSMVGM